MRQKYQGEEFQVYHVVTLPRGAHSLSMGYSSDFISKSTVWKVGGGGSCTVKKPDKYYPSQVSKVIIIRDK